MLFYMQALAAQLLFGGPLQPNCDFWFFFFPPPKSVEGLQIWSLTYWGLFNASVSIAMEISTPLTRVLSVCVCVLHKTGRAVHPFLPRNRYRREEECQTLALQSSCCKRTDLREGDRYRGRMTCHQGLCWPRPPWQRKSFDHEFAFHL